MNLEEKMKRVREIWAETLDYPDWCKFCESWWSQGRKNCLCDLDEYRTLLDEIETEIGLPFFP